ncbi:MAG: SdrD B-like domain-containing protein [Pseudomonadota bacterium]
MSRMRVASLRPESLRAVTVAAFAMFAIASPVAQAQIDAAEGTIESALWKDANRDGRQDAADAPASGVPVTLLRCDGAFVAATRSDARGQIRFDAPAGCYRMRIVPDKGDTFLADLATLRSAGASLFDPTTGLTPEIELGAGDVIESPPVALVSRDNNGLGDRVWEDLNANGVQDVGEPGLQGVSLSLIDCDGNAVDGDDRQPRRARTDRHGRFSFGNLPAGCYEIALFADDAWQFSPMKQGPDALDSDIDPTSGHSQPVAVDGAATIDIDVGLYKLGRIGNWVWFDTNADGIQNLNEHGVSGIEVLLLDAGGVPTGRTARTNSAGYFEFAGLIPGLYRVQYAVPRPYRIGERNRGVDVQLDSDANALGTTRVIEVQSGGARTDVDLGLFGGEPVDIELEKLTNGVDADEPTGPLVEAGGDVLWEYIVTNTGDADLFDVAIVDDQGVSVTCPSTFLATGQSFTCTGSTDDAQAGQYVNMAEVCGNDQTDEPQETCDQDKSHYFGVLPSVQIETLTNGDDADGPTGPEVTVGLPVMWSYVVTNTGNITLTDIVVTDSEGVAVTCPSTSLEPGFSMTCTAEGTSEAGQYMNLGSVAATPPVGDDVSDSDPSHYFGLAATLRLEKRTNGVDADVPPGPTIGVGETVTWEYEVFNDGNVPLSFVTVTDDQGVVVTCPQATVPAGSSMVCTGTGVATEGLYRNIGEVCARIGDGPQLCTTDTSHYTGAPASIEIETLTQHVDADDPTGPQIMAGDPVNWEYVVTNTGGVTLSGIVVSDDQGVTVTCPTDTLAPGEVMTCTALGTAEAGQYANIGSVSASGNGQAVSDSDPSHYFGVLSAVNIEKTTNGLDADAVPGPSVPVGNPVTWTYTITNTGNTQLTDVAVSDDQGVQISCPPVSFLDPGESLVCTGTGTAAAGQYMNIGQVCMLFDELEVCDTDTSHYFGVGGGLSVEKSTNGVDADLPPGPTITVGEPITWTYVVTNTGNATVTGILVADDQGVDITCPVDVLGPGESMTCTGTGVATDGPYVNVGSATGQPVDANGDPVGPPVSGADPSHYTGTPANDAAIGNRIFVDSNRNGVQDPNEPGVPGREVNLWIDSDGDGAPDTVVGTMTTGNDGLYLFTDLDPSLVYFVEMPPVAGQPFIQPDQGDDTLDSDVDPVTGITGPITLAPGETNTTIDGGITKGKPGIQIEKATNGVDADSPSGPELVVGTTVTWTYTVTNVGEFPLIDVVVSDDQGVTVVCPMSTLGVGETMTCSGSGIATLGQYANLGMVSAQPVDPNTGDPFGGVSDSDPSHYLGVAAPVGAIGDTVFLDSNRNGVQDGDNGVAGATVNLWIDTTGDGAPDQIVGMTTTDANGNYLFTGLPTDRVYFVQVVPPTGFAFTQANVGDDALDSDVSPSTGISPSVTLSPGQSDLSIDAGLFQLKAGLDIEKFTNGEDADTPTGPVVKPGSIVTWTYTVTNIGETTVSNIVVSDDQGVAVTCPATELAAGASMSCTGTGVAITGQYANIGSVSGQPTIGGQPAGGAVGDSDPSHYLGSNGDACVLTNAFHHGMWFDDIDLDNRWDQFDFLPAASYEYTADGALVIGTVQSRLDPERRFDVQAVLRGATTIPPAGSPKNDIGADTSDWIYYPDWEGVLVGVGDYAGARLTLVRLGPAWQEGTGANEQAPDIDVYGASAWFNYTLDQQSDRCLATGEDCIRPYGAGDFNIRLDCPTPAPRGTFTNW